MLTVAVLKPDPLGLNVTTNVVELLIATLDAGAVVTEKSVAFAPENVMLPMPSATPAVVRF